MFVTIRDIFEQTTAKYPNMEAIYDVRKSIRWTYREWHRAINRLANGFRESGIGKGDVVSTLLYNGVEFCTIYFACTKIGAIINPINFRLKEKEIVYILRDAGTKLLLFEEAFAKEVKKVAESFPDIAYWNIDSDGSFDCNSFSSILREASEESPVTHLREDDLYAVMYSSGTTGKPKGVMHCHREVIEQSMAMIAVMKYAPGEKGLVVNPLYHCGELHSGFFSRVHVGGGSVIMHRFQAQEALKLIQQERIASMVAVPTIWNTLLGEDLSQYDLSAMKVGMYGGEAMAQDMILECLDRLAGELVQAYGMTEMGPTISLCVFSRERPNLSMVGSAGKAVLNHEIRVVRMREDGPSEPGDVLAPREVGEIIVRGNCAMAGYLNNEAATAEAMYGGWYHTGDIGYMDEEGVLWVVDRKNNMIVSGGENIYPREVENVLAAHPDIIEAAVVGKPDPKWGESVVAFVVRRHSGVTAEGLDAYCIARLANYKRPRFYRFVDELPRNSAGKIMHHELKELARLEVDGGMNNVG